MQTTPDTFGNCIIEPKGMDMDMNAVGIDSAILTPVHQTPCRSSNRQTLLGTILL